MKETGNEEIFKEVEKLKKEISGYPIGSISRKMINGKERYYHQWYESGKTKSKYLKQDEVETIRRDIELRRIAEKKLDNLEKIIQKSVNGSETASSWKGIKHIFNKELKAGVSIPLAITGLFDGRYIIPDGDIHLSAGQKILVTVRDVVYKPENINLDKYINQGEKLFPEDAQKYIRELRNEERI